MDIWNHVHIYNKLITQLTSVKAKIDNKHKVLLLLKLKSILPKVEPKLNPTDNKDKLLTTVNIQNIF